MHNLTGSIFQRHLLAGAAIATVAIANPAMAQTRQFNVPAQTASRSIPAFARQAGIQILASGNVVANRRTNAVRGQYSIEEGLRILLQGTGLTADGARAGGIITIRANQSPGETDVGGAAAESESADELVVTGTRIRGAPPSAPVIEVTSEDIRNAGQSDLGEVVRSLPQNFGGGQNPGIGRGQGAPNANLNVNSASTINLRGMGQNATLTLLNGNRLSYSATSSAIDISAIPVAAVSRVEILADGASALYGSDAVAGVANIILRRDFSGISATTRYGASTEGGNEQAQLSLTGGARWRGGGAIAVFDYFRQEPILAGDRSYTSSINPGSYLYPRFDRYSTLLSARHQVSGRVTLSGDLLYKWGDGTPIRTGTTRDLPIESNGQQVNNAFESFIVAPSMTIALPGDWSMTAVATYGYDDSRSRTQFFGPSARQTSFSYSNQSASGEINAEGRLFTLPGGTSRLAVGAGLRRNELEWINNNVVGVQQGRENYYIFGELYLPVVGRHQNIPFINELSTTLALRLEKYSGLDNVVTPKISATYRPVRALSLRASWGESFRTPTLFQQFLPYGTALLPVSGYGNVFPANATFVYLFDGNPNLEPERASTLVLSAEFTPEWAPGLIASISYFRVNYSDRITLPFSSIAGVLTNPVYASFVTSNPTSVQIDEIASGASSGLVNATGRPYDPSSVVAILDGRNVNATRERYRGVDVNLIYSFELGAASTLRLSAAASYLESDRQLLETLPTTMLAGTIFNPPHFRARGGLTWSNEWISLSGFLNFAGAVTDRRRAVPIEGRAQTTFDATGRFRLGSGIELGLVLRNLLNAEPEPIFASVLSDTPFDSTNYSAEGRYVGISVTGAWQ